MKLGYLLLGVLIAAPSALAAVIEIDGRKFTLPDGFTIEKVAAPPLADRPIVADFDEQGRLYVADSSGTADNVTKQLKDKPHRILRLEDTDNDGRFDKQTIFADRMMFPEGTMFLDGSLYVAAPPSIWKLTDTDNDGVANQRVEWFQGRTLTGCANDLHGPYAGPDGLIYWTKGAFAEQAYDRGPGKPPLKTKAAHIFRARPDGSAIEPVMTGGMDNPVDVAFTPAGERIFTTTFFQHPAGGKRDGLIHAVYGGVYGKTHNVIDNHPRTSPDVMPVLSHLGPAAPAGLTRYESDAFGPEYRDNLFAALFNLHKVTRHVLTPSGATFTSRDEDFVTCDSRDFHPTDVIEDADGSLLIIDTGGWYKLCCPTSQLGKPDLLGAIYRVRREAAPRPDDPRGLKLAWATFTPDQLAQLLDDARPAVRRRAIQALAARGPDAIRAIEQSLARSSPPLKRLNAVWAATRIDAPSARAAVRPALHDPDETVRHAACHSASVWRDQRAGTSLVESLQDKSPHVRRAAAEAFGRLANPAAVPMLIEAIQKADPSDPILEHSLTFALIEIADAQSILPALATTDPRVRRCALTALDQITGSALKVEAVSKELTSPDPSLRETAAWIAGRHPEWADSLAVILRHRLASRLSDSDAAQLRQQLSRLSKSPAIQSLLADRITDPAATPQEKRLALESIRDSALRDVPRSWTDALAATLAAKDTDLVSAAVAAVRALPNRKDLAAPLTPPLLAVASRTELEATLRLAALAAVPAKEVGISAPLFDFLLSQLSPDQPLSLRTSAADGISRAKLTPDQLKFLLATIKTAGPLELDRLLAAFEQSTDDRLGTALLAALKDANSLRSVPPDSIRKRFAKFGPNLQRDAESLLADLHPDAAAQKARLDKTLTDLPPGDIRRGQAIFNSERAACATCHAVGYLGGTLGPDLTKIGATRQDRDLLESILFPSASFVQTYAPLLVQTKSGDHHAGILKSDTPDEIILLTAPDKQVAIARSDIKSVRPSTTSVMPDGLEQQLTRQELADLLAFLKASK